MNLLALACSPKKGRNTDILVDELLQGAKETLCDHSLHIKKIYINSLSFRPCQDCGYCRKNESCSLQDDMTLVYKDIEDADGMIVSAPTYYGGLNAQCKMLIDRCFRFNEMVSNKDESWTFQSRIKKRKKLIFVGANGSFGKECVARQKTIISHLCNDINAELYQMIFAHKTDYYPVIENGELRQKARLMGKGWVHAIALDLQKNMIVEENSNGKRT